MSQPTSTDTVGAVAEQANTTDTEVTKNPYEILKEIDALSMCCAQCLHFDIHSSVPGAQEKLTA